MSGYFSVGKNVFVGGIAACNHERSNFALVVHVFYGHRESGFCEYVCEYAGDSGNLVTACREGEPLGIRLEQVVTFVENDEPVLIHCGSAHCRAPTFAVLALCARGVQYKDALNEVATQRMNWAGAPHGMMAGPLEEIRAWAESAA